MVMLNERLPDPDAGNGRIATLWWAMALRGVCAIVLATLAFLWPAITLIILVFIFAAYCIVDASFSIVLAVSGAARHERWWWPALHALVGLATAAVALLYPGITTLAFVAMLIVWALLSGLFSIAAAVRLDSGHGRWWLVASGMVSLLLAMLLMAFPALSLLTLSWTIAFQALLAGGLLLGFALRLRLKSVKLSRGGRGSSASSTRVIGR